MSILQAQKILMVLRPGNFSTVTAKEGRYDFLHLLPNSIKTSDQPQFFVPSKKLVAEIYLPVHRWRKYRQLPWRNGTANCPSDGRGKMCQRGGGAVPERTMRTPSIVMPSPVFYDDFCLLQNRKKFSIKQFVSQLAVEAFAIAVFLGLTV
jgi:hypothetical protein